MSVRDASSATASAWRTTCPSRKPVILAGPFARYAGRERYKVTDRIEARVLAWTTKRLASDGSTHWSSRKLAAELGDISHMTVSRIWAKHKIKPHRPEGYLASDDPDFERKAADVIGLYLNPPQHAAVFCVDEKTAPSVTSGASSVDTSATITTGERTFPYQWMHRTRGRCIRQTGAGWSHFPNSAARTTTTNDWQRDPARNRSVLVVSDERGQRRPCRRVMSS